MKSSVLVLVLLAGAAAVRGQGVISSHSGWSIQDTLETAPAIVVATVAESDCADTGTQESCRATLRVLRNLKGAIAPRAVVPVRWDYRPTPLDEPEPARRVPEVTAMWFLRPAADGGHEALVASGIGPDGGVYLRVPDGQPGGDLFYTGDAAPEYKIAREAAAALVAAAPAAGMQLGREARFAPGSPEARKGALDRIYFDALAGVLRDLPFASTAVVYAFLSGSPSANLMATGLAGRLRAGDACALIELERELPRLSATPAMRDIGTSVGALSLKNQPAAAQALARLALSEIEVPGLEGLAPMLLAGTNSFEFLPTLAAMLHSPDSFVRGSAWLAVCNLLRPAKFRDAAMAENCPENPPSELGAREQENIRFWIEWWQTSRPQIPELAGLRDVPLPVRYARAEERPVQVLEVPAEERFFSLVSMLRPPSHYHTESGAYQAGVPPGDTDPFRVRMSEEDYAAFLAVVNGVNAQLDAILEDGAKMMGRARFTGGQPDRKEMQALNQRRTEALQTGLAAIRNKLSPEGWNTVEQFLREMNIHQAGAAKPGNP